MRPKIQYFEEEFSEEEEEPESDFFNFKTNNRKQKDRRQQQQQKQNDKRDTPFFHVRPIFKPIAPSSQSLFFPHAPLPLNAPQLLDLPRSLNPPFQSLNPPLPPQSVSPSLIKAPFDIAFEWQIAFKVFEYVWEKIETLVELKKHQKHDILNLLFLIETTESYIPFGFYNTSTQNLIKDKQDRLIEDVLNSFRQGVNEPLNQYGFVKTIKKHYIEKYKLWYKEEPKIYGSPFSNQGEDFINLLTLFFIQGKTDLVDALIANPLLTLQLKKELIK